MTNDKLSKFFPGNVAVGASIESPRVNTAMINGVPTEQYVRQTQLCDTDLLQGFVEEDGGLRWKNVQLVPPNSVMEDRGYTDDEMETLVSELWSK